MLTDELNKLIECIQLQVNRKTIAFSDIEHTASSLIINDEFDSLPDDVRGELFFRKRFSAQRDYPGKALHKL